MNDFENVVESEEIETNADASVAVENAETKENVASKNSSLIEGVMHQKNMQTVSKKQKVGKIFGLIGLYLFLTVMAFIVVFPFVWMLGTSLKHHAEYYDSSLDLVIFPAGARDFLNYAEIFDTDKVSGDFARYFLNTLVVGVASTLMSLVITVVSAFALSRLEFKGRETFFAFLLATMMIPGELFTITNYKTVADFGWLNLSGPDGWVNAFLTLTIPFLVSVFYIYLLRQNFMQIPNELYLAAKVDGTTDLKYLWKVMVPLALPTLISITILKMMGAWTTYMWPKLTMVSNHDFYLITIGLREAFSSADNQQPDIPLQMATVTLVSLPLFMVFIFFRKYIMKGVSRSGIKG